MPTVAVQILADQFFNSIEYTFNFLLSVLGIKYKTIKSDTINNYDIKSDTLVISYGTERPISLFNHHIHIYSSHLFSEVYRTHLSMPKLKLNKYKNIPIIYEGNGNIQNLVVQNENTIETNIDIIASSFFMLSRYEEYIVDEKDQYGRFPASASIAYKEGFLNRPIVNEYIELLWEWIDSFNLGFRRKKFWNGYDFVVCLTHDIDTLRKYHYDTRVCREVYPRDAFYEIKQEIKYIVKTMKKGDINHAIYRSAKLIRLEDPYWNLHEIAKLEKSYGFNSSFYFFGGGNNPNDANYSIANKRIQSLLKFLQINGFDVGLHGSFDSFSDYNVLRSEKERLSRYVDELLGIRQHSLRFDIQKTLDIHEKLGFKYDTTLGFAQYEGFRCGLALPFYPYNIDKNRPFKTLEIPLNIMDATLTKYRNLKSEEALDSILKLLDAVKKYNGCLTILWHNSFFDYISYPDYIFIYKKILKWIAENGGKGTSAKEILNVYEKNLSRSITMNIY